MLVVAIAALGTVASSLVELRFSPPTAILETLQTDSILVVNKLPSRYVKVRRGQLVVVRDRKARSGRRLGLAVGVVGDELWQDGERLVLDERPLSLAGPLIEANPELPAKVPRHHLVVVLDGPSPGTFTTRTMPLADAAPLLAVARMPRELMDALWSESESIR